MSSATPTVPPPRPARRWRKRWTLIPAVLLLAVGLALAILFVRGTWADTQARNPAAVGDGPVSQLYETPDGHKEVRCAVILPHPVADVWTVLTDYPQYGTMLPYLKDIKAEQAGTNEYRMTGQAESAFRGYWPFEIVIHEEKTAEGGRIWWNEKPDSGEVEVNRGSWTLTKHGDKETFLVLSLETEVKSTPSFLLRNFFRHRLKVVVRNVDAAVRRRE